VFFERKGSILVGRFAGLFNNYDVFHCVSTRRGGVSRGEFSSLNLGSNTGDDSESIRANIKIFLSHLNISEKILAIPGQIHSSDISIVKKSGGFYPKCDGLITNKKNVCLSLQTADCVPLFLYAEDKKVIGLVHAGWRGAEKGIAESAVKIMISDFDAKTENIFAYIGPCIRQCCYEIKEDVASYFPNYYINNNYLDLPGFIMDKLFEIGIRKENVEDSGLCTACHSDLFFSYRKSKSHTGRMLSLIMIR